MKKKILIFMFRLSGGGAERTIVNIINNLNKELFEVVLVLGTSKRNEYLNLVSEKIKIVNLDRSRLRYSIIKLRKIILIENPDLLFSTLNDNNIVLSLAALMTKKKIPVYIREANNRTESGKVSYVNRKITSFFYNKAKRVIALSKGVEQDLINNFNISPNIIKVIYNPIEVQKIREMSKEKKFEFEMKSGKKIIIGSGRLVEQKDFQTLIKGFSILLKSIDSYLVILGKGPELNNLQNLCKCLNIEDRVFFMGFQKNPYKYMRMADLFVLSSRWEGFGHVIVEAMSLGIPVISSNCKSGPSEIIGDDDYGILFPVRDYNTLANKMIKLLTSEEVEHLKEKGKKRAKDFDAKKIVKSYERIFINK